jgi:hypothetical protein
VAFNTPPEPKAPDSLDTYAGTGSTVASQTKGAPSLPGGTLRRHTSKIRTGCANKRPSGSVRGVPGNWYPYRDRQLRRSPTTRRLGVTSWLSLALIGNASGADCGGGAGSRSEAFSIRRLGGSRWRLRRTRCAMGFERQPGSEQSLGRAMRPGGNAIRMVGVATEMSKSARGKLHERQWRSIGHTRASACRSTSSGR